jgi:hypothetical protein
MRDAGLATEPKGETMTHRKPQWDCYRMAARRSSARWATTDRGWYYSAGKAGERRTIGHYLDYGPTGDHHAQAHDGATIHAVICREIGPGEARWFRSVDEAKAWIETAT